MCTSLNSGHFMLKCAITSCSVMVDVLPMEKKKQGYTKPHRVENLAVC